MYGFDLMVLLGKMTFETGKTSFLCRQLPVSLD